MKRAAILSLLVTLLLMAGIVPTAWAHGTDIRVSAEGSTISVDARFETDEPMSEAQIIVYAPDNPREAWQTGVADAEGQYNFDLDPSIIGEWAVTIRTGGHGEIVHLNVNRNGSITIDQASDRSTWRTVILTTLVLAALGGVAYYYRREMKNIE